VHFELQSDILFIKFFIFSAEVRMELGNSVSAEDD